MKLHEIRKLIGFDPNQPLSVKAATRTWLCSMSNEYPIAVTLTIKQVVTDETPTGTVKRTLKREDCEFVAMRFQQKLNRAVFGKRGAERYGKSLKYIPILEGECSHKHLHLHFAIGGLPKTIRYNNFPALVLEAKSYVRYVDEQHKVDIADSGWIEYITKETGLKHSDNVLWQLLK